MAREGLTQSRILDLPPNQTAYGRRHVGGIVFDCEAQNGMCTVRSRFRLSSTTKPEAEPEPEPERLDYHHDVLIRPLSCSCIYLTVLRYETFPLPVDLVGETARRSLLKTGGG